MIAKTVWGNVARWLMRKLTHPGESRRVRWLFGREGNAVASGWVAALPVSYHRYTPACACSTAPGRGSSSRHSSQKPQGSQPSVAGRYRHSSHHLTLTASARDPDCQTCCSTLGRLCLAIRFVHNTPYSCTHHKHLPLEALSVCTANHCR